MSVRPPASRCSILFPGTVVSWNVHTAFTHSIHCSSYCPSVLCLTVLVIHHCFQSLTKMPRKCTIFGCVGNYDKERKCTVYQFPSDPDELQEWLHSLPNNIAVQKISKNVGICKYHWPADAPMKKKNRFESPAVPPSVWTQENNPFQKIPKWPNVKRNYWTWYADTCIYKRITKATDYWSTAVISMVWNNYFACLLTHKLTIT